MPTIAAIATPPGQGGIGIVRLSGPGSKTLLSRVFLPRSPKFSNFRPWTLHRGALLDSNDEPLDDVLAVYMPGPRTYTGEEMAEIHCHGGPFMVEAAMESLYRLGARLAEPGEFTRRAYLNGRLDLSQAEAVAELISAPSREAARHSLGRLEGRLAEQVLNLTQIIDELRALSRVAIDFPDDEIEGLGPEEFERRVEEVIDAIKLLLKGAERARLMADGATVVLAGPVNAGKSSIFNALVGTNRALVTEHPGTTRDYLEQRLLLDGLPINLVDTAGLRESVDEIENMGIARSRELLASADLAVIVLDGSRLPVQEEYMELLADLERADTPYIYVWNKADLGQEIPDWIAGYRNCAISAKTGANLEVLSALVRECILGQDNLAFCEVSPNIRQKAALEGALEELIRLVEDIKAGQTYDCCLARLDMASEQLGSILALAPEDELLNRIFSQFCIGK